MRDAVMLFADDGNKTCLLYTLCKADSAIYRMTGNTISSYVLHGAGKASNRDASDVRSQHPLSVEGPYRFKAALSGMDQGHLL